MQFIDLAAQQARIRPQIEQRIQDVLNHGKYIMGPEIGELEKQLADYAGVKHSLACASGTDALLLALMAMEIGPGDAVFTSPFTFIATAEVVSLLGATTVFVDIEVWARQAETCAEYLCKGSPIFVEGRLKLDQWENQQGEKRSKLRVRADRVQFLGSPKRTDEADATSDGAPQPTSADASVADDDDIPF